MLNDYKGSNLVSIFVSIILCCVFLATLLLRTKILSHVPSTAYAFLLFWLGVSILFSFLSFKEFVPGFLVSLFSMMIAWRIAGIYDLELLSYPLLAVFLLLLVNFIFCAVNNINNPQQFQHQVSLGEWQLIFVRLYLGLNFVPHFTEKLFSGTPPRQLDINAFTSLGINDPSFFVWLAGLCEFAASIGVGLGFLMRWGALGAVLYLMIATFLGHHFSKGFIWANPGGGWEYATMWMVLIFAFVLTKSHQFSIDQYLEDRFKLYSSIKNIWKDKYSR